VVTLSFVSVPHQVHLEENEDLKLFLKKLYIKKMETEVINMLLDQSSGYMKIPWFLYERGSRAHSALDEEAVAPPDAL
jgi:hypothetical protein